MTTSNVNNQGIAHIAFQAGGQPFCKSRRAHIVISVETHREGRWHPCKRCAAKLAQMDERAAGRLGK